MKRLNKEKKPTKLSKLINLNSYRKELWKRYQIKSTKIDKYKPFIKKIVLFGSFITTKENPTDIDIYIILDGDKINNQTKLSIYNIRKALEDLNSEELDIIVNIKYKRIFRGKTLASQMPLRNLIKFGREKYGSFYRSISLVNMERER